MTASLRWLLIAAPLTLVLPAPVQAADADPAPCCAQQCLTLDGLVRMSKEDLEALYCQAEPGPMPHGYTCGRAIRHAGTCLAVPSSKMAGKVWLGKHFDSCSCMLLNQWCHGIIAVPAKLSIGESWCDGKPAIIMDYRGVSPVIWRKIRDELRQVAPGLYLGIMYQEKRCEPKFKMFFALQVDEDCCPGKCK